MSKNYAQIANDIVTRIGVFRQGAPDTVKAFGSLSTAATATKALDTKTKELIAVVSDAAFTVNRDTDQADRRRAAVGAFHAQVRPHLAITLSRKDWHWAAIGAVGVVTSGR